MSYSPKQDDQTPHRYGFWRLSTSVPHFSFEAYGDPTLMNLKPKPQNVLRCVW